MPDRILLKMNYSENFTLTSGANTAVFLYKGNDIFDPSHTNTGSRNQQPLSHDQWATFYGRYVVVGSRMQVTAYPSTSNPATVALLPSNVTSSPGIEMDHVKEQARVKTINLSSGGDPKRMTSYLNSCVAFGKSKTAITSDDYYSASFGASPSKLWYWQVASQHPDGTTAVSVVIQCKVTYYCMLYDRIIQPIS